MKTVKLLKTAALAASLAAGAAAHAAVGDIFEIRPCNEQGVSVGAYASAANPMIAGSNIYFNVRLVQRTIGDPWKRRHTGLSEELLDDILAPLEIGIYVSGQLRFAKLHNVKETYAVQGYTDLIFKYTTMPGDFALPIVLATKNGSVNYTGEEDNESYEYLLNNTDKWAIVNDAGNNCNFWLTGSVAGRAGSRPETDSPKKDYSLEDCGFYVRTVDFDNKWESTSFWRTVHEGSRITAGPTPSLVADSAPTNAVTLYVWSTDTNAVFIAGGTAVSIVSGYDSGNPVYLNTRMGTVTLAGGQLSANFEIEGATEGESCNLVLSMWPRYNFNASYVRKTDYLTVPVKCVEPLPATIMVEAESDKAYVGISNEWQNAAAVLNVYLTQPAGEDLVVTVTPSIFGQGSLNMADYVKFSTEATSVKTIAALTETATVTLPAGLSGKANGKKVYAFLFRGDEYTDNATLDFTPSITPAQEASSGVTHFTPAGIDVEPRDPEFVSPVDGGTLTATAGEERTLELTVADTWADQQISSGTGYKIEVKLNDAATWTALEGDFYIGSGGLLRKTDGSLPVIKYTSSSTSALGGVFATQIRVTEPINKNQALVSLVATVNSPKTVTITADKSSYNEGEAAQFTIELSASNDTDAPLYAFLVAGPGSTATESKFDYSNHRCVITDDILSDSAKLQLTDGIPIPPYTNGPGSPEEIYLLDGGGGSGSTYFFSVKLCTTSYYDPNTVVSGYNSTYANIKVKNVEPVIKRIEMNGNPSESSGYAFPNKVPKGSEQSFEAIVDDPGEYDLEDGFQYKWTVSLAGVGNVSNATFTAGGGQANNTFTYNFPRAGDWTIKLQVKDKDMKDWAAVTYTVGVSALDNPGVEIEAPASVSETDRSTALTFYLSYWDPLYSGDLRLKITVKDWVEDKVNPGKLILDSTFASADPNEKGVYYVTVNNTLPMNIVIEDADGTTASSTTGFRVRAEVVGSPDNPNFVLPTSNSPAKDYYLPREVRVLVDNATPVIDVSPEANTTNEWTVAGGVDTLHPLRWTIRSDVDADFTDKWPKVNTNGVKVAFTGCDNETTIYVTEPTSGVFYPDFGDGSGKREVSLTIEDKDGGYETFTWKYTITASKFLSTTANGPSGGLSSKLSQKFGTASGIGSGHIYVRGATFSSADNFTLRWNCGSAGAVNAYALGYKVASPIDNGSLDGGRDVPLTKSGDDMIGETSIIDANCYTYPRASYPAGDARRKDSYLFGWLLYEQSEDGAATATFLGDAVTAERPGALMASPIPLPTDKNEDESFTETVAEAIFALEYLPEDNLGDINQDGIPDVYASVSGWSYGGESKTLVEWAGGSSPAEDGLVTLGKANIQSELLPGVYQSANKAALVSEGKVSYGLTGPEFTARLKIRGFHEGLNDTINTRSDPSFSDDEQAAYEAYLAENPDVETAIGGDDSKILDYWSPEPHGSRYRRMNPATDDTDEDSFPDAWEYFFWYQAKVWAPAGAPLGQPLDSPIYGVHQNFVFERFDISNITHGVEIPASEVLRRFHPCEPISEATLADDPDFDGDGLSDLEELLIGTNPCHWDSDGDGMADGWEVMMCLDPLSANQGGNEDGDFMACHLTKNDMIWLDDPDADPLYDADTVIRAIPNLSVLVDYDLLTGETLRDLKVEGFSFKPMVREDGTSILYGRAEDAPLEINGRFGLPMVTEVKRELFEIPKGTVLLPGGNASFVLIHNQVRDAFGFDPRTGWYKRDDGFVAGRWSGSDSITKRSTGATGSAVNTEAYSNYDEYLVMQYRRDYALDFSATGESFIDKHTLFDDTNPWTTMRLRTTNPSNPYPERYATTTNETGEVSIDNDSVETEDTTTGSYAKKLAEIFKDMGSSKTPVINHGADTDEDGVPDGWELYMYRSPNCKPQGGEDGLGKANARDFDGDGLSYAQEYAGVDSCDAYKSCRSIYQNHPGNVKGWFNKFFPSHPGTVNANGVMYAFGNGDGSDTDLDGVPDGDEGGTWDTEFYNDGKSYTTNVKLGFVYGVPTDDGSTCIRGGGMNPCTIDTDQDGIPDGWEMQHAGVPVQLPGMTLVVPRNGGKLGKIAIGSETFVADGVYNNSSMTNEVVYIAGGMDATWGGDATTDSVSDGRSWDRLLGLSRDVDFDHDGLQNYQEYLVQSVRHLRYDDISTPLMGRVMTEGIDGAENEQKFMGYVPFDPADPVAFVAAAAKAWYGEDAIEEYVETTGVTIVSRGIDVITGEMMVDFIYIAETKYRLSDAAVEVKSRVELADGVNQKPWTEDGWRDLGYFARPRRYWDRSIVGGNFAKPLYMMPITGSMVLNGTVAGYASSDPRMADTDSDGMDDYYEMFHGLNPLLGNDCTRQDETTWLAGKAGDMISAIYRYSHPAYDSVTTYNAYLNEWVYPSYNGKDGRDGLKACEYDGITDPSAYDPILYPWVMGSPSADADGDGIRNAEERLLANAADPATYHTDPTPRWFTDRTATASYVRQYYAIDTNMVAQAWFPGSIEAVETSALSVGFDNGLGYMFAFEENEGYDTDGDFKPDALETITTTAVSSDPLRYDDPYRRQALYLDGVNSYAMTTEMGHRAMNAVDLFRQFTVECWIRPEQTGVEQTVLERSTAYPAASITADAKAIRANFRIGIAADGYVYGMFDNDDAVESGFNQPISCQVVKGDSPVEVGKWRHVALTFDGSKLSLYENGVLANYATTTLIPANGVYIIHQGLTHDDQFPIDAYRSYDNAFFVGARPKKENDSALHPYLLDENGGHLESFDNMREWYKGWVDEIRVWDGARSAAEIFADYDKAYTSDDVLANRDEVFSAWRTGATRNNNSGEDVLPPELVFHYNFVSLPGAVNAGDVMIEPSGFTAKVREAAYSDYASNPDISTDGLYGNIDELKGDNGDDDIAIYWWNDSDVHSTVYTSYHVLPTIQNTVAHLPAIDGTTMDSTYYSKWFGGVYTPASEFGVSSFTFPNTANPYGKTTFFQDLYNRVFTAERRAVQLGEDMQFEMTSFAVRALNTGATDLVPMGGAYAKACDKMWDGAASKLWEFTGDDADGDGLPDWWEEYARHNSSFDLPPDADLAWDTMITYNGEQWPAGKLYVYELAKGLQPDGTIDEAYADVVDADGNGIPDWWEDFYGVSGSDVDDDSDGDGLSNYAEYVLSEVFDLGVEFNPTKAKSVNGIDLDYFVKIGDLYAGEIFTDFDMIEDPLEDEWGTGYASRYAWDALADKDEDGWSNFAEARYYDYIGSILAPEISHVSEASGEMKDMPIPALRLTLRYNGDQPLTPKSGESQSGSQSSTNSASANLIVQTFTKDGLVVPDATYRLSPGKAVSHTHYIGAWSDRVVRGTLAPGFVQGSSFALETLEPSEARVYIWHIKWSSYYGDGAVLQWYYDNGRITSCDVSGSYNQYLYDLRFYGSDKVSLYGEDSGWMRLIDVSLSSNDDSATGTIVDKKTGPVGMVNRVTGDFELDLGAFAGHVAVTTNGTVTASLESSLFRITYKAEPPVLSSNKLTLNLGEADTGYVKEGKNTIVAFYDLDGNGKYTAGEPFGCASGVEVGWRQGAADIELTDTSPIITRADLLTGMTDRSVAYGIESGDNTNLLAGVLSEGIYQRLRVVRTLVNGYTASGLGIANRVLVDKEFELDQRSFFYEGDVLENGELDLDWSRFNSEVVNATGVRNQGIDPTEVAYRVVLGNGSVSPSETNNLFSVATVRHFDPSNARQRPTALSPGDTDAIVFGARPTFKWTMDGNKTYTAFKIEIRKGSSTVWTSDIMRAPSADLNGVYTYTANAYVGDELENGEAYTWRVSMYNAKFTSNWYSTNNPSFRMNAPVSGNNYSTIPVAVRYFGPSAVAAAATYVVEAFTTPDFTGDPVARTVATDGVTAQGNEHVANAVLTGLAVGKYYVRAYIDFDESLYGKRRFRDECESWGYACARETSLAMPFTPTTVVTVDNKVTRTVEVYIEDTDVNGNRLPDAWEIVKNGGSLYNGVNGTYDVLLDNYPISRTLSDNIKSKAVSTAGGAASTGLDGHLAGTFNSPAAAALAMGVDPSKIVSVAGGVVTVESEVEDVEITSVEIVDGKIVVKVDGTLAPEGAGGYGVINVVAETEKTVTCKVFRKENLADEWGEPVAVETITVGAGEVELPAVGVGGADSGFFKVTVE